MSSGTLKGDGESFTIMSLKDVNYHDLFVEYLVPGGPYATSDWHIRLLYKISCLCLKPFFFVLDSLLSIFIRTTDESYHRNDSVSLLLISIKVLLLSVSLVCFLPLALFGFIIWLPLQLCRPRPYSYIGPTLNERHTSMSDKYERIQCGNIHPKSTSMSQPSPKSAAKTYSVITANICLMPEFIAHINNLTNTIIRGKQISSYFSGDGVVSSVNKGKSPGETSSKPSENNYLVSSWSADSIRTDGYEEIAGGSIDSNSVASTLWSVSSKECSVSDVLPTASDFICLQEVFDSRATDKLLQGLKAKYPYIIYDVVWPIHNYRITLLGSGLCIASRYPFIDIDFKPFADGNRDDKLACKGILMTKVYLGHTEDGDNLIGYLATTHLQAWSHSRASSARCKQINAMEGWIEEFQQQSRKVHNNATEKVLFNMVTGDFNFDKISHCDRNEQRCSVFQQFVDPCIDEDGAQHSWVIGTELNQKKMHDERVRTPQGLQRMLISELERHQYVASTTPARSTFQRVGDGKRRIDYILYKQCDNTTMAIKDYKFFTGLATLTDHIPVGMMFSCDGTTTNQ
ncbi:sphingomyelin phosphodiesterase 5-like isoform X2 [Clavelina lepadiformis]|uniref:sphingomyelin phosphodiesterase 5-like isoform X2 n=1 Tax=Clavelina lepadiformis TaxID=159417 RepID=UPI00404369C7